MAWHAPDHEQDDRQPAFAHSPPRKAFGDIDAAFDADGMAALLAKLEYSAKDAAAKKPLPNGIVSDGEPVVTMSTLRHAANKYRTFRLQQATNQAALALPTNFAPSLPPANTPHRGLKPTGFWIFQANPSRWKADEWLASGEPSLLYFVSKDDRDLIQVGDLGVVRRTAWRGEPAAILALVEVVEATTVRPEPDPKFFVDMPLGAEPDFRVRLERLAIFDEPVTAPSLPGEPAFDLLRKGLQRTTTPFPGEAFAHLSRLAGYSPLDLAAARAARSRQNLRRLQAAAQGAPPKVRAVVSRRIERGPIGDKVKAARGHRCQVCEALGQPPIAFRKPGGQPYAEAHHVIFVSTLGVGVLDAANVMVLCPNHHRQAHYGAFEILSVDAAGWTIRLDGIELTIPQTSIW